MREQDDVVRRRVRAAQDPEWRVPNCGALGEGDRHGYACGAALLGKYGVRRGAREDEHEQYDAHHLFRVGVFGSWGA